MIHCFPEFVEADVEAGRFAGSPLQSPPRIEAMGASNQGVRFERVLVPVDLTASSLSVLRRAGALAAPDGIIQVLHAVQLNIVAEERGIPRTGLIRELHDAARQELEKLVESLWANETPAAVIIREGRPKDVIVQEALACNADLIVMSAHHHLGWRRVLHRDTANYVMRHAPCPALVVRS
jgi:nucleotide-binding universal stress UspA family protein